MPFDGYLEVGGREIVNSARTFHYVSTLAPAFGLRACQDCDDLGEALGETYTTPEGDDAPWFDQSDPETGLFYGFYPLAIEGLTSSTRESVNVELVGNGSVQTSQRRAGRDLMVRGLMFGETREALDKGFSWLDNTLNSDECDGEQAHLFSACPEVIDYPASAFEPLNLGPGEEALRQNLAQNPNFSTANGSFNTPIARVNLSETPNYSDGSMDQQDGSFTILDGQLAGSGDMAGVEYRRANIDTPNAVSPISFTDDELSTATVATAGNTYTLSAFAFQSAAMYDDVRLDVQWIDGADAVIQTDVGALASLPDSVWTRASQTLVAPANTARVRTVFNFIGTGGVASEFIGAGGLLIEEIGTLKPLIVGSISRDANLEASFSGADYDSTTEAFVAGLPYPSARSLVSQDGVSSAADADQPHAFWLRSEDAAFANSGDFSGALVSDGDGDTDVYANVTETGTAGRYLLAGRTYRISAYVHVEREHVGPFNPDSTRHRSIAIVGRNASDTADIIIATSGSGVNADDTTTRVSVTVAMNPALTTGIGGYIRLYNGSSSVDEPVWWDELIVEDVTDAVPLDDFYFDGDTSPNTGGPFDYEWDGISGASISTQVSIADFTGEDANWQSSSGSISGSIPTLDFSFDTEDGQKAAWRQITGFIPGEQYQLRMNITGQTGLRIRIGNEFVTPDDNKAPNPRWIGSQFDSTIVGPAPAANMFDEDTEGPLGFGWRKYVYPSDTGVDTITVTDIDDQSLMTDVIVDDEMTISSYAFCSATANVELVVRFFDQPGSQIGSDEVLDMGVSDGDWVQLSGVVVVPSNGQEMQTEVRYTPTGAITAGTEFGVGGLMASVTGGTAYFDGFTEGYRWTGPPDASVSEIDADVEWVTYSDIAQQFSLNPPNDTIVLDFVPRGEDVTLYIDAGGGGGLTDTFSIHAMRVWRIPNPGVVAFSTNTFDMVPPADGWTYPPIADTTVLTDIQRVFPTLYTGQTNATIRATDPAGATVPATHGPERTSYGLKPGVRYILGIAYTSAYFVTSGGPGVGTQAEVDVEGAVSQTLLYSADVENAESTDHYRLVEFIPASSSVTLSLELGEEAALDQFGFVRWNIDEVLVEEVFEEADTSQPDPLRLVSRTMYGVTAISGPEMTNLRRTSCGWMAQVTFGLRAGKPGLYRDPVFAGGLPTSVSTTVDAIPCVGGQAARLNFMYNPSVETAIEPVVGRDDYLVSGGTITRENGGTPGPVVGEWFVQGAGSSQLVGYYSTAAAVGGPLPSGGGTYTHSVFISADVTGSYDWLLGLNYLGGTDTVSDSVNLTANVWTRIENTFTIPPGDELDLLEFHHQDNGAISGNLWMDGYMVEPGTSATAVWDETSEGASWTSTANESALMLVEPEEDITLDPDCQPIPLPPQPPNVDPGCVEEPDAYERSVITISDNVVPRNLTAFPVLTILAGAQDVRQARIRFWENPDGLPLEDLGQCAFDGDIIVSFIPAGATLVIDGVQRIATMTLDGVTQDATHLLYGADGAPVDWPDLTGGIEYLVTLDLDFEGTFSDTQMTVELVVKD